MGRRFRHFARVGIESVCMRAIGLSDVVVRTLDVLAALAVLGLDIHRHYSEAPSRGVRSQDTHQEHTNHRYSPITLGFISIHAEEPWVPLTLLPCPLTDCRLAIDNQRHGHVWGWQRVSRVCQSSEHTSSCSAHPISHARWAGLSPSGASAALGRNSWCTPPCALESDSRLRCLARSPLPTAVWRP